MKDGILRYLVGTDLFKKIDTDKIVKDLHIIENAEDNAKQGQPPLDSTDLDSKEREVVGYIEDAQSHASQICSDELNIYEERLIKLNFRERLGDIDLEISKKQTEFNQKADEAKDELRQEKKNLIAREEDLKQFKEKNGLNREVHAPSRAQKVFLGGLIAVLFLIETIANASFLAKGNEWGLFGAYTEAIVISFLNLGIAFLFGRLATYFVHILWSRKFVGIFAVMGFVVIAIFLNLLVAHYREIAGTVLDEGGRLAFAAFRENPLGLKDFQSWILFLMGCLFAIFSFIDGLKWDDPYPGYRKYDSLFKDKEEEYKEIYEEHQESLKSTVDEVFKEFDRIKKEIVEHKNLHHSILNRHQHLIKSFEDHLDHLESAGNTLLMIYREANCAMRDGESPERFKKSWKMKRKRIDKTLSGNILTLEEILKIISEAEAKIGIGIEALQKNYDQIREELSPLAPHSKTTE